MKTLIILAVTLALTACGQYVNSEAVEKAKQLCPAEQFERISYEGWARGFLHWKAHCGNDVRIEFVTKG